MFHNVTASCGIPSGPTGRCRFSDSRNSVADARGGLRDDYMMVKNALRAHTGKDKRSQYP
jgi:hypothetical protein